MALTWKEPSGATDSTTATWPLAPAPLLPGWVTMIAPTAGAWPTGRPRPAVLRAQYRASQVTIAPLNP